MSQSQSANQHNKEANRESERSEDPAGRKTEKNTETDIRQRKDCICACVGFTGWSIESVSEKKATFLACPHIKEGNL